MNYLCYLYQPEITRQIPFELTDIDHNKIKDENSRIKCVEYNTDIGQNSVNEYDMVDLVSV